MELKGSKTEQNLMTAFAGESQARNKYTYYASQAKKDGYVQISRIFEETANNEREHAKLFYEYLGKIDGHVDAVYPFELGTTEKIKLYDAMAKNPFAVNPFAKPVAVTLSWVDED